jgi:hypothetical protein
VTAKRSPGRSPDLDVYDIAFLAGGAERVVDTALVALVESGRLRVHGPGELAVVEPSSAHPVEAAVTDAVGAEGHCSIDTIRSRLTEDARIGDLGRALCAAGLLRRRLRFGHRASDDGDWSLTASGREALDRRAERPSVGALDRGSALHVALYGRSAMPDADPWFAFHRTGGGG